MTLSPASSGWRSESSTTGENSGNSSRKRTPRWASETSPGRARRPPPTIAAIEAEWCGARNGRRSESLPESSPAIEAIIETSRSSCAVSAGRIEGRRWASIDLPEPGGPTISMVCHINCDVTNGRFRPIGDVQKQHRERPLSALEQTGHLRSSVPDLCRDHNDDRCRPELERSDSRLRIVVVRSLARPDQRNLHRRSRRTPARSCMGGCRTPAHPRSKPSRLPASGKLLLTGRSLWFCDFDGVAYPANASERRQGGQVACQNGAARVARHRILA